MIRLDARLRCAFDMLRDARSVADIGCDHGKLTRDTGWEPEIGLDEILKDTLEWWRNT